MFKKVDEIIHKHPVKCMLALGYAGSIGFGSLGDELRRSWDDIAYPEQGIARAQKWAVDLQGQLTTRKGKSYEENKFICTDKHQFIVTKELFGTDINSGHRKVVDAYTDDDNQTLRLNLSPRLKQQFPHVKKDFAYNYSECVHKRMMDNIKSYQVNAAQTPERFRANTVLSTIFLLSIPSLLVGGIFGLVNLGIKADEKESRSKEQGANPPGP